MGANKFFNDEEKQIIVDSISRAELGTSAEIRVHIDSVCLGNPLSAAVKVFNKLEMYKTKDRNGVLIYVAFKSNKCAIIGDDGINQKVGEFFWDDCYKNMTAAFKQKEFCRGVAEVVLQIGDKLREFFPYETDDVNELSNEISIGK